MWTCNCFHLSTFTLHLSESAIINLGILAEEKNQCPSAATFKVEPAIRTIVPRFAAAPHGGHHSCRVQRPVNALAMFWRVWRIFYGSLTGACLPQPTGSAVPVLCRQPLAHLSSFFIAPDLVTKDERCPCHWLPQSQTSECCSASRSWTSVWV